MFKLLKYVIYIIILLVLVLANPSQEKHQKAIQEQTGKDNAIVALLGGGWVKSKLVTYSNYYVCSITNYNDTFVSLGVAGYVWVGNIDTSKLKKLKSDIEEKIDS